jgi:uncharacterized membrane protein YciS (DUF1049 family)
MALLKKIIIVLAALLMLIVGWTIGMENSSPASFVFFGFQFGPYTLGVWTLLVFGLGLILGVLVTLPPWLKSQRTIKRYHNKLLVIEKQAAAQKLAEPVSD